RMIGQGGMGVVYEAVDERLGRRVAVKVMGQSLAGNENHRQRFLNEARALAALRSEHVVTVYQAGEDGGQPFLVMEYLEGLTLDGWLKARPSPPSPAEMTRLAAELLAGLAAVHARGLTHR